MVPFCRRYPDTKPFAVACDRAIKHYSLENIFNCSYKLANKALIDLGTPRYWYTEEVVMHFKLLFVLSRKEFFLQSLIPAKDVWEATIFK